MYYIQGQGSSTMYSYYAHIQTSPVLLVIGAQVSQNELSTAFISEKIDEIETLILAAVCAAARRTS